MLQGPHKTWCLKFTTYWYLTDTSLHFSWQCMHIPLELHKTLYGLPALQADSLSSEPPGKPPNAAVTKRLEKVYFHTNPKKGSAKECTNYHTIVFSSHASKVILKILQARLQQRTWTENFQMFKLDLEKTEEPKIKLPTSVGSEKRQENSRKISTFALLTMVKPLTMWITTKCWKLFKRWEYLPSKKPVCRSRSIS